ncbi:MAG: hypothetical protein NTY02_18685 [Acidobacteria bacterium]|nr:hypothetical protein [Acidobacteriota bacterium]
MPGPDGSAARVGDDDPGWRRRWRIAAWLWAAFAIVVWNVVFDAVVIQSGRDYLTQQALHQQGRGPAVTIPQVMRPGIRAGLRLATFSGGGVAAVGAAGVWLARRRRLATRPR